MIHPVYCRALCDLVRDPADGQASRDCARALLSLGFPHIAEMYLREMPGSTLEYVAAGTYPYASGISGTGMPRFLEHPGHPGAPRPFRTQHDLIRLATLAMFVRDSVLVLGCAPDLCSILSAFGTEVFGVSSDPLEVDLARYWFYDLNLTCGHFRPVSGLPLPDRDSSFDAVVLVDVLQKVPDPDLVLKEAARVVKPGGRVIISVPNAYCVPAPDQLRFFTPDSLYDLVASSVDGTFTWIGHGDPQWLKAVVEADKDGSEGCPDPSLYLRPWPLPESNKPLVSMIVPTYNRAKLLPRSVASLLAQTYSPTELIVVNDGSTDETDEAIRPFVDRITYIKQPNRGSGAARNAGIRAARGKYIWFFDDDDVSLPRKLEVQVPRMERSDAGFIHASAIITDQEFNITGVHIAALLGREGLLPAQTLGQNMFFGTTVMARRTAFEQAGLFDENLVRAQDYDMWIRLLWKSDALSVDYLGAIYHVHSGRRGSAADSFGVDAVPDKTRECEKAIFRKVHDIPLEDIFPALDGGETIVTTEALLRRAQSMDKRGLEDLAERDLRRAADLMRSRPFSVSPQGRMIVSGLPQTIAKWSSPQLARNALTALKSLMETSIKADRQVLQ